MRRERPTNSGKTVRLLVARRNGDKNVHIVMAMPVRVCRSSARVARLPRVRREAQVPTGFHQRPPGVAPHVNRRYTDWYRYSQYDDRAVQLLILKHERVARRVAQAVEKRAVRPGQRLPSVRALAAREGVSPATAVRAYERLIAAGLVETRPQSGHYVATPTQAAPSAPPRRTHSDPRRVRISELITRLADAGDPRTVAPLGGAMPAVELLPGRALRRVIARTADALGDDSLRYAPPAGMPRFREQLARRSIGWRCALPPEDFVVTSGASEALSLALQAVTEPGDVVAVESPGYYGVLQIIETLNLHALEVPSDVQSGLDLEALGAALRRHRVRAVVIVTNVSNPLGITLAEARKQELVEMLAASAVALVEDDVWGDLSFGLTRPVVAKAYDQGDRVLLCGSFSKTLAPGLRIGWVATGRYRERIELLKFAHTMAAPTLSQAALAEYLASGGYDRHLRRLQRQLAEQVARFRDAIVHAFPSGTAVSRPAGGCFLWVELPQGADTLALHARALADGVRIMPGPVFSARSRFRRCLRINCGHPWSRRMEDAILTLGTLATRQL